MSIVQTVRKTGIVQTVRKMGIVQTGREMSIVQTGREMGIVQTGRKMSIVQTGRKMSIVQTGRKKGRREGTEHMFRNFTTTQLTRHRTRTLHAGGQPCTRHGKFSASFLSTVFRFEHC